MQTRWIPWRLAPGFIPSLSGYAARAGHFESALAMVFGWQSGISGDRIERVRSDQIGMLYRRASLGVFAALLAGVIVYRFLTHYGDIPQSVLDIWLGVMIVQSSLRLVLIQVHRRISASRSWRFWAATFCIGALAGGITWGIGGLWLMAPGHFDRQLLVILVISALVSAALSSFGSYLPAFYAFFLPAMVPLTIWSALQGDVEHQAYALLSAIWIPVVAVIASRFHRGISESLDLHYQNLDLLDDVRLQKERAEEANRSKSRFLASASHDLRQPVHALGLTVGALRAHPMSDGARRLVDHIEGSITALDGLFTSLLDISRLDAGVIKVEKHDFAIQPLLERICQDHQADAAQKGVILRLAPCSATVHCDPVLLARILRNIIINAVSYTEKGRVLVGCRHGAGLRIEVWDTGPGIAPAHREQVFSEFFQIANPGRDRSKGLGLGLAIVRRLMQLLDLPLELQSETGRGSVFRVTVPLAARKEAPASPVRAVTVPAQGVVLVIDDEIAIREAMISLLESWGYSVIAAGSGAEMLRRIADCPYRPILIVCDYRLQGEDGIAVIRSMQSEFNEEIPAMLVTGDTAPDRLLEARASGLVLLHKPLSADRLQAAITAAVSRERVP